MARYADWERIPMAEGGKDPMWPLPTVTPKFATWSLGGGRPSACAQDKCERWHAGVDLTGAPQGALVVAPEDALIVGSTRAGPTARGRSSCAPTRTCSWCWAASSPARTRSSA
jgi:hypothetical protein